MAADRLRGADPRDREGSVVAAPGHATRGRGRDRAPGDQGSPACGHRRGEAPGSHWGPDRGRRRRALLGGRPTRGRGARSGGVTTKLTLQYDGAGFAGWAAQPEKRTVQGELEAAIGRILGA